MLHLHQFVPLTNSGFPNQIANKKQLFQLHASFYRQTVATVQVAADGHLVGARLRERCLRIEPEMERADSRRTELRKVL